MKRSWTFALLIIVSWCTLALAGDGSPEETAVRAAYSKVSKAVDAGIAYAAATGIPDYKGQPVTFELSDFRTGPISDIAGVEYRWLVTEPKGEEVFGINRTGDDKEGWVMTENWIPGQTLTEDWAVPMSQLLPKIEKQNGDADFTRFAAYTVKVTHEGKSRTYKALCLFGDLNGNPVVLVIDTATGLDGNALEYFHNHPNADPTEVPKRKIGGFKKPTDACSYFDAHFGPVPAIGQDASYQVEALSSAIATSGK